MATARGISPVVTGLLVVIIGLASTTAYLGFLQLQPNSNGNIDSTLGGNILVSRLPGVGLGASAVQTSSGTVVHSITVGGTGQVRYSPNEALVSVSIVTIGSTAEEATARSATATTKVIRALNSIEIDNASIQTQGYYLSPNFANNYGNGVPPAITGYTVTNSLMVNITSGSATQLGSKAGQAIDTAVLAGANQISLQFAASSSLLSRINNLALQAAVESAAAQAQVISSSLHVNITGVISAVQGYSPYYSQSPNYHSDLSVAALPTPLIPGTQSNTVSITVVYSIS